jgi:hypothetical protein
MATSNGFLWTERWKPDRTFILTVLIVILGLLLLRFIRDEIHCLEQG